MRYAIFGVTLLFISLSTFGGERNNMKISDDSIQAQTDRKLGLIDNPSHFEAYMSYLTKISYAGRYFGTGGIGLYPSVVYKHKSGIAAGVSNYVWTGYTPAFCQSVGSISYSKEIFSWMGAEMEYSRNMMFYGTDSDKRAMPNSLSFNVGLYLNWVNVGVDYGYMFGYEKASGLHIGLNHDFALYKIWGSDKLTITPSVGSFYGPQSVFYYYFSKSTIKKINRNNNKKSVKGQGSISTTTSTVLPSSYEEDSRFQTLAYQAAIAITYRIGRVAFEIAYRIDIPTNLPIDYQYGTSPVTYFNGSLRYKF